VPGADDLALAVAAARARLEGVAGAGPADAARLVSAGEAGLRAMRRFERRAVSASPPATGPDEAGRRARHDVNAAAQTVLAQLELIALAWESWDPPTRDGMLDGLEASVAELAEEVARAPG
jgi:hypothetical protein